MIIMKLELMIQRNPAMFLRLKITFVSKKIQRYF